MGRLNELYNGGKQQLPRKATVDTLELGPPSACRTRSAATLPHRLFEKSFMGMPLGRLPVFNFARTVNSWVAGGAASSIPPELVLRAGEGWGCMVPRSFPLLRPTLVCDVVETMGIYCCICSWGQLGVGSIDGCIDVEVSVWVQIEST